MTKDEIHRLNNERQRFFSAFYLIKKILEAPPLPGERARLLEILNAAGADDDAPEPICLEESRVHASRKIA